MTMVRCWAKLLLSIIIADRWPRVRRLQLTTQTSLFPQYFHAMKALAASAANGLKHRPTASHLVVMGKLLAAVSWSGTRLLRALCTLRRRRKGGKGGKGKCTSTNDLLTISPPLYSAVHEEEDNTVRKAKARACRETMERELGRAACFPTVQGDFAAYDEHLFVSTNSRAGEPDFPNVRIAASTLEQLKALRYSKKTSACLQTLYSEILCLPDISEHQTAVVLCKLRAAH